MNLDSGPRKRNFELPGIPRHRQHVEPDHEPDFKEIMNCNGNITIDGIVSNLNIKDHN